MSIEDRRERQRAERYELILAVALKLSRSRGMGRRYHSPSGGANRL